MKTVLICLLVIIVIALIVFVCWVFFGKKDAPDDGQVISLKVKSVTRSANGDMTFHMEDESMPFSECPLVSQDRSTMNGLDLDFFNRLSQENLPPQARKEMLKKLIDAGIVEQSLLEMDSDISVRHGETTVRTVAEPPMEQGDTESVEDGSKDIDGKVNPFAGDTAWDDEDF